jgi:hypothetical protein
MTVVLVGSPQTSWVAPTAVLLRERGARVVELEGLATVGYVLLAERTAVVVVDARSAPVDWASMRDMMMQLSPQTRVLLVDDASTAEQLAQRIVSTEGP